MNETQFFAEERQRIILEKLEADSKVLVPDLADFFNVSLATIRTDLRELENAGQLIRTHGGAIPLWRASFEQNAAQKQTSHIEEKHRIAKAALGLVKDGDTIAIDTGTTAIEFAKALQTKSGLTIITNDLIIAAMFEDATDFNIIMIGGRIRKGFHCTLGEMALESINDVNVDLAILCANAFNIERGFMTPTPEHAEMKKRMKGIASKTVMLMGSYKIGGISLYTFAGLSDIDVWITDDGIGNAVEKEILDAEGNLELIVV